ncbi:MAG: ankyrin repeat domain-containing protein [Boseongicola sp.]
MSFRSYFGAMILAIFSCPNVLDADPIHDAAKSGDTSALNELLELGSSIEAVSALGTPLHIAVREGHLDVVELLIERGADVNAMSLLGPPVLLATRKKELAILQALMAGGANPNSEGKTAPILVAAKDGQIELVELLLDFGADPNFTANIEGFRAIHEAAKYGHADIVDLLIQRGADVSLMTARGETALHFSIKHGNDDVVSNRLRAITNPVIDANLTDEDVANADIDLGREHTEWYCSTCHDLGEGGGGRAPRLQNIVGSRSGFADPEYPYSQELIEANLIWGTETLDRYLLAAQAYVPGTKMETYPVEEAEVRAHIIAYLETLSGR